MKNKRLLWIDNAKGIAILLVMWGHVVIKHDALYYWITTFHVPMFLVLTGYLYEAKNKQFLDCKNIFNKIIRPFLIFSIISIFTDCIYSLVSYQNATNMLKMALIDVYKTVTLYGIHALWYLPAYVIASLIYFKLKQQKHREVVYVIFVLVGAIYSCVHSMLKELLPSILYLIITIPAVTIIRALVCAVFLFIGRLLFLYRNVAIENKVAVFVTSITALLVTLMFSIFNGEINFSTVEYGNYPFAFIVAACFSAIGIILLVDVCKVQNSILQFLGENSLILLVTHHSLKLTYFSRMLTGYIVSEDSFFFGVVALIILTSLEIVIIRAVNSLVRV